MENHMNKDELYFKNLYNEFFKLFGKIAIDNEMIDAYVNREDIYKRYNYMYRCPMVLQDIRYQIAHYDERNHNKIWSFTLCYYSLINKEYYQCKLEYFELKYNKIKYLYDNDLPFTKDDNNGNIESKFIKDVESIVEECKLFCYGKVNSFDLFLLIDKKLHDYFIKSKQNGNKEYNTIMKELEYLKKIERSIFSSVLKEEKMKALENLTDNIYKKTKKGIKTLGSFANDEFNLIKKYINKRKE